MRQAANIARFGHVNVMLHSWVIWNDQQEPGALLQSADNFRAAPLQHTDDGAGVFAFRPVAPHQHVILVQGSERGIFGNGDFLDGGVVRLQKALAGAVDADAPGNQIRFARQDVAVALDAGDAPPQFEPVQFALQVLLPVAGEAKLL